MAAGLDPARFWDITPRLYRIEMDGAAEHYRLQKSLVWFGAMLPNFKKPMSHDQFVGRPVSRAERLRQCLAAWDAVDRSLRGNRKC